MKLTSSCWAGRARASCFLAIAVTVASVGGTVEWPGLVGRWPWGPSHAVTHYQNHVFFGSGAMLQVANVDNPDEPVVVGNVEVPDLINGLWAAKDVVFAAADDAGLRIIDVSWPPRPREVGFLETEDSAIDVTVVEDRAYVVTRNLLLIVDITDLEHPVEVGRCRLGGSLRAVAVRGAFAYVAGGSSGLHIVDVWVPDKPEIITSLELEDGYAMGLALRGRYVYVAALSGGLRVVDIWDPFRPFEIGSHEGYGKACDVVLAGDWAYVAYHWDAILRYYVADPSDPQPHIVLSSGGPAVDVDASDDLLFSAGLHGGFHINPLDMGLHIGDIDTFGDLGAISANDGFVAVFSEYEGLQLVDASDPLNLVDLGRLQTSRNVREIVLDDEYAVLLIRPQGLQIVDLASLDEPTIVSTTYPLTDGRNIVLHDGSAYVADGMAGFKMINLADPMRPELVASLDTPDAALDVAVRGEFAYIAEGNSGLRVIDILGRRPSVAIKNRMIGFKGAGPLSFDPAWRPGKPVEVGRLDDDGYTLSVEVDDRYVYVLNHGFGFRVIDANNPFRPVEVGRVQVYGWGEKLAIAGKCAFATTTFNETLKVINLSNPTAPVIAAEVPILDRVRDLWVDGERLYVGQTSTGFLIYDVSSCF